MHPAIIVSQDHCWECARKVLPICFPVSLETVPEVLAKCNSALFPNHF